MALERVVERHETRIMENNANIQAILTWRASIEKSVEVQKELVEVGQSIIEALGWVARAAKWICQVGAAVGVVWGAIKGALWLGTHP